MAVSFGFGFESNVLMSTLERVDWDFWGVCGLGELGLSGAPLYMDFSTPLSSEPHSSDLGFIEFE
jgi:hypothetical protein